MLGQPKTEVSGFSLLNVFYVCCRKISKWIYSLLSLDTDRVSVLCSRSRSYSWYWTELCQSLRGNSLSIFGLLINTPAQLQFHNLLILQLFVIKINLNCINFVNNLLVFVLRDFRKIRFLIKIETLFLKYWFHSCIPWERRIHRLLSLTHWEEDGSEGNTTKVYKYPMRVN